MATPITFDGFTELSSGVNMGISPSLIQANQVAFAKDFSFRGGFVKTRPPYANLPLSFDSETTETNFTGIFQGACFYQSDFGQSGFVVSRGGRLFFIAIGMENVVSEITPILVIVTTSDFTVPAPAASVTISVSSETVFTVGQTIFIDSGEYTVTNRSTNQLTLTYVGSAANPTVTSGAPITDSNGDPIIEYQTNPSNLDFVYLFQAENYVIVCAAPNKTIIYDGTSARQSAITGEIPPCVFGTYGWGRIWVTLQDRRTFAAGDIVYGPSGTEGAGFRDAILKFTENDFLNEGGNFGVPFNAGLLTSMQFLATQDTSLGVGVLLIGTTNMVFSVNAPVDRTTWKNLEFPIQTVSLLDYGPTGPRSPSSVNGDMWYRSPDGMRSFIVARRDITTWGNTPVSREIGEVLAFDTKSLLFHNSSVLFDNKLFTTISPYRVDDGVVHRGVACINFDLISNLRTKTPPSWEGIQTGLTIFQILKGTISNTERMFAFALNDDVVELWEFYSVASNSYYDTYTEVSGSSRSITRTAIEPVLETRSCDFQSPFVPKLLNMGEVFMDDLVDNVQLVIKFRPDQYPTWITWSTLNLCSNVSQCTVQAPGAFSCTVWKTRAKQYAARVTLPSPPETCNTIAGIPVNRGHEFQFRLELTGHARIRKFRCHAIPQPQETEGVCPSDQSCTTFEACSDDWFTYSSIP